MADLGKEIGWDDAIENEGTEPLPEGTYEFTVASMERAHFGGSEKMAPCNVANLDLLIKDKDGKEHHVFDSLYLNSKAEWRLSQFFLCIGQKKKGEALRPNWNEVPCSTGKVEVMINEYVDKNGNKRRSWEVQCESIDFCGGKSEGKPQKQEESDFISTDEEFDEPPF